MRFKNCESCLVYGSDKKPLCKARVSEVKEDEVRLYFSTSKLRNARLKTIVDFYDEQKGLVRCLCEVVLKKNPGFFETGEPWMGDCAVLKIYETFQRQKDVRVKVKIASEFVMADGSYVTGTIQNISAGGMYFITARQLNRGDQFIFVYKFKTDLCKVEAKVLRVQEQYGGYGYGCQFIGLTPNAEADIRSFVYNRQIKRQLMRKTEHGLAVDEES